MVTFKYLAREERRYYRRKKPHSKSLPTKTSYKRKVVIIGLWTDPTGKEVYFLAHPIGHGRRSELSRYTLEKDYEKITKEEALDD